MISCVSLTQRVPDVPVLRGRYWSMAPVVMPSSQVGLLLCLLGTVKGIVHPKMKIQPLSTRSLADGRLREFFEFTKVHWSFTENSRCSNLLNNYSEWGAGFKH